MPEKRNGLDDQHNVSLTELLNNTFISHHSTFSCIDDFFEASGFKIESREDFEAIPDDEWDQFINQNTSFNNWKEMLKAAGEEWVKKS
ncbi:MAG: hypothetical protein MUP22_15030 [Desulfobacterales bacterium]|nr:hypothetical protein [Desulfobacterales bacterium]